MGRWPRARSPTARSRTYSSVPVRLARMRLVIRTRSAGPSSGARLTVAPERVRQRPHVLAEAQYPVVHALGHALLAVRLVIRLLVRVPPAVRLGRVRRAQALDAERRRAE